MFHGFIPYVMGTRFDLLAIDSDPRRLGGVWTEIEAELTRLDRLLNRFDPASEVARVNAGAAHGIVEIGEELEAILRLCRSYYERTEHLFDVTLRDFSRLGFPEPGRLFFGDPSLSLDFGGLAKGYALREVERLLRQASVGSAFVDFGNSSILCLGRHPYGSCWKVSLPDPYTQQPLDEFDLEDRALSTSGNTAQHTGHIVNPLTGEYDRKRKVAAVVAADPLDAEVLSTVWMVADAGQRDWIGENFKEMQATLYTL